LFFSLLKMKKRLNLILSLVIGIAIFAIFFYRTGIDAVWDIFSSIEPLYLGLFALFTTLTFVPAVLRWKIVLRAHGKDLPFLALLRYTIMGYAVSYVTPSARIGGEPLRAYMVHKEQGMDLKTATSSVIIEKFVELSGSIAFGIFGLVLIFLIPNLDWRIKLFFGAVVLFGFSILLIFYYRSLMGKGSFSSLFLLFRLNKIARWNDFVYVILSVEKKMQKFFVKNKKEFFQAFLTYLLYGVLVFFEFNFLFKGLGFNEPFTTVILAIVVSGFVGFIPIPGGLGFLEAGQSALLSVVKGQGSLGFAFSLFLRIRGLVFVAIGFVLISYFSGGQLMERVEKKNKKKSRSTKKY